MDSSFVEGVRVEEVKAAPSNPCFFFCTGENVFTWSTESGPRPSQLLCCKLLGETRVSLPLWGNAPAEPWPLCYLKALVRAWDPRCTREPLVSSE